jgi:RNA polymerase sigma-70 factor (ECF subfamily)
VHGVFSCHNCAECQVNGSSPVEVTELLVEWSNGDRTALDRLMPLVYDELHRLSARQIRKESPGHSLQTTALIHEAYLRLIDQTRVRWQNRAQFFGIAAQIMRRILVDYARSRGYLKRGGSVQIVSGEFWDEAAMVPPERCAEVVAVDDALNELAELDPRKSQIVELRFFGGLSIEETAAVLKLSPGTIMREWTLAKAWLHRAILSTS